MSKIQNPARGHKVGKHHPGGKTYDVLSIQRENVNGTKVLGEGGISKATDSPQWKTVATRTDEEDTYFYGINFRCS